MKRTVACEQAFKDGHYVADNIAFAKRVWRHVKQFAPVCRKDWKTREFVLAIGSMMCNPHYDQERMLSQIHLRGMMTEVSTVKPTHLKSLQAIYNYGLELDSQLRIVETAF
jgi:hypothetical protein